MRLSNKQYTVLVRLGIALVLIAVLAIDKAPSAYQPWILALAAVGGVIGFFPLFTSKPFASSGEDYESVTEPASDRYERDEPARTDVANTIAYDVLTETAQKAAPPYEGHAILVDLGHHELHFDSEHAQFRLDSHMEDAFSLIRTNLAGIYPMLEYRSTLASMASAMESINQRAARVREMHDLVDKLIGTTQRFSVELTSSDSIIVHCEGSTDTAALLDSMFSKSLLSEETEDAPSYPGRPGFSKNATVQ